MLLLLDPSHRPKPSLHQEDTSMKAWPVPGYDLIRPVQKWASIVPAMWSHRTTRTVRICPLPVCQQCITVNHQRSHKITFVIFASNHQRNYNFAIMLFVNNQLMIFYTRRSCHILNLLEHALK